MTWRLPDGTRDILGLWIDNTEGAKFWLEVCNDLKTLGVEDILIAVTDGLKGIAEALEAVSTATTLQTCTVHLIRGSLSYASCKDRKALAAALSRSTRPPALRRQRLSSMPSGTAPGDRSSTRLLRPGGAPGIGSFPLFAFPPAVRRVIYTTNALESVNARLREIIKTRGHFPVMRPHRS